MLLLIFKRADLSRDALNLREVLAALELNLSIKPPFEEILLVRDYEYLGF